MKRLYKFFGLIFIFGLSVFLFRNKIPEAVAGTVAAASLQDATFPIVYIQLDKFTVNAMHGYSSRMDSGDVRESITPLGVDKTFTVKIAENESKIKKLDFELKDIMNEKIIEQNSFTAFDFQKNYKVAKIKLTEALDTSTEYGFEITLTTNQSKKIYFYTRIKYYENDFSLKEKITFVNYFHKATFDNGKSFDITNYLEPGASDNSTFADVDISSSYRLITWGNLNPSIITDPVPVIKELNIETAAIEQDYYVKAETPTGMETFFVKEFYRVRYSGSRMYLLNFKRTMEAMFNPDFISLRKSELKIGISDDYDFEITSSSDNKKFAFVRNGSLWYYNLSDNKLHRVFSFESWEDGALNENEQSLIRDNYDRHDIKILRLNDDGTISFIVYGYMNCGDYEGRVGIILYDYMPKDNRIVERVYMPLATTYERLKLDLGDFCYVNDKNIFYFSLNDVVYAYNISSKKYEILTENASKDNFVMLEEAKCFVWSDASKSNNASSITILNLETSESLRVSSKKNQSIVVLGTIDANIVYGYVKNGDIYEDESGEIIRPAYKLTISDCDGNILREYRNKNIYVTKAVVDDNVIRLKRAKKVGKRFVPIAGDDIMNQKNMAAKSINITMRVTEKALTEKYISLPAGYVLEKKPLIDSTEYMMVTENTTLHLDDENEGSLKYYVYAYGTITACLSNPAEAIRQADEQMGVVMDSRSHIIWERGGRFISKEIANISYAKNSPSSVKSAAQMLLQAAQRTTTVDKLKGKSIISMLSDYLEQPVNLKGCTLDQVLYFVSGGKPVIGMLDGDHAVLITAYTSSTVSWMDPVTLTKKTSLLSSAENMFKDAGYMFVSYVSD